MGSFVTAQFGRPDGFFLEKIYPAAVCGLKLAVFTP
jgi:hypothetical protein